MSVTVHHGDCIEVMRELPDSSVDSIVTDPPYGLGFMGKAWDSLPPGEDWARECLRVLKPGGHLLAFGGTRTWHRLAVAVEDAGFDIRDSIAWMYGSGFPKHRAALKPAFEPVVMARRPFKGTLIDNEAIYQTGALSIEDCRIGSESRTYTPRLGANSNLNDDGWKRIGISAPPVTAAGRWPANVILDEAMAEVLDGQSGNIPTQKTRTNPNRESDGGMFGLTSQGQRPNPGAGETGGASRFFYVAKAPKKERPTVDGTAHPTVKPLALMQWLVRLVTPAGGTVLEPFAGSGTTVEACILEGFDCVAIEREAEYLPLIQARIERATVKAA